MDTTILVGIMGVLGGLVGVILGGFFTRWSTKRQIETLISQIGGEIHERLYNQNHSFLQVLSNYPELRPYFYENKDLNGCNENQKNLILLIAEMQVCFFELVIIHLPKLESDRRNEWINYIKSAYESSPATRSYMEEFKAWYFPDLHQLLSGLTNKVSKIKPKNNNPNSKRQK